MDRVVTHVIPRHVVGQVDKGGHLLGDVVHAHHLGGDRGPSREIADVELSVQMHVVW